MSPILWQISLYHILAERGTFIWFISQKMTDMISIMTNIKVIKIEKLKKKMAQGQCKAPHGLVP